jgi:hypothetical protein
VLLAVVVGLAANWFDPGLVCFGLKVIASLTM